jgi:nitroreductase
MDLEQAIRTRRTHKAYSPEPVDDEAAVGLLYLGTPVQEQRVPERAAPAEFVRYLD